MAEDKNRYGTRRGGPGWTMERAHLKDVKGTAKRLIRYLMTYKNKLLFVLCCSLVSTLITITGTRLNGYIVDTFIADKNVRMLFIICLVLVGMYLAGVVASYVQNIWMISISQNISAKMRSDLFCHVQKLPLSYFDTHSSGDVMSRLTNDMDNVNNAMSQTAVQVFTSIISIVGMLIAMLMLSPLLTLVCLIATPLTIFTTRTIAKVAQKYFVSQQRELGRLNGFIEEMVSGQKVLRLFSREKKITEEFDVINRSYISNAIRAQIASGLIGPSNNTVNNLTYLLISALGAYCVIKGIGGITVGVIFSFLLFMRNFTNPINNILMMANSLQLALASAERVFETMDQAPETDGEKATDSVNISGNIQFKHVDFSYVPDKPVLRDASISAESGQTVALVGPTGAGKTTIISLLPRFYDKNSGEILIDGRPIEGITRSCTRKSVSLVLQDTFLFSASIIDNIRFGNAEATDEEVINAAKRAHAHEFIMQLPMGYETVLSDNGQNLSQGQRQLLNIARAIVSKASVLILDEATSSVDTRTELLIQKALLELMKGKTSFVIAHRISTIKNADKILVIQDGHVSEEGTHQELLNKGGFYANLYSSQFRREA